MNLTLWVSAALMTAGAVLALVVRPRAAVRPLVAEHEDAPQELAA